MYVVAKNHVCDQSSTITHHRRGGSSTSAIISIPLFITKMFKNKKPNDVEQSPWTLLGNISCSSQCNWNALCLTYTEMLTCQSKNFPKSFAQHVYCLLAVPVRTTYIIPKRNGHDDVVSRWRQKLERQFI